MAMLVKQVRVFVSSPGDVRAERNALEQVDAVYKDRGHSRSSSN
jgi:hypothetical protein